jgi:hypothetical protein
MARYIRRDFAATYCIANREAAGIYPTMDVYTLLGKLAICRSCCTVTSNAEALTESSRALLCLISTRTTHCRSFQQPLVLGAHTFLFLSHVFVVLQVPQNQ